MVVTLSFLRRTSFPSLSSDGTFGGVLNLPAGRNCMQQLIVCPGQTQEVSAQAARTKEERAASYVVSLLVLQSRQIGAGEARQKGRNRRIVVQGVWTAVSKRN